MGGAVAHHCKDEYCPAVIDTGTSIIVGMSVCVTREKEERGERFCACYD